MAIADYISPVKKKISLNSDFRKDLLVSPVSFDVVLLKDEEAVKESIKNFRVAPLYVVLVSNSELYRDTSYFNFSVGIGSCLAIS